MSARGRTVREALAVALEGVGHDVKPGVVRDYLDGWIKEYALARGVVVSDADVRAEIEDAIAALRRSS